MTNLAGLLDYMTTQANYRFSANGLNGTLLPAGAMLYRDFKNNQFEYYAQDSWRIRSELALRTAARPQAADTEQINGQQVQPMIRQI